LKICRASGTKTGDFSRFCFVAIFGFETVESPEIPDFSLPKDEDCLNGCGSLSEIDSESSLLPKPSLEAGGFEVLLGADRVRLSFGTVVPVFDLSMRDKEVDGLVTGVGGSLRGPRKDLNKAAALLVSSSSLERCNLSSSSKNLTFSSLLSDAIGDIELEMS